MIEVPGPSADRRFDAILLRNLASVIEAFDRMGMSAKRYLLVVLVPAIGSFVGTILAALSIPAPMYIRLPIPLFGLLILGSAVMYPKIALNNRKLAIENQFHLVITHMTVLSTTNIDRMEVLRTLGREDEYGELAAEIRRIVQYVDTWNRSLDDACRRRAKTVPSKSLSDFLDRLAYTIGAGQGMKDFLLSEQSVMIQNYVTIYESALDNLEVMKDLYLSMILSMTFALVFAIVLPILTGTDPVLTIAAVIVMFAFVQLGFFMLIKTLVPHDPVWYYPDWVRPSSQSRLVVGVIGGCASSAILLIVLSLELFGVASILPVAVPEPILVAIPLTPLLVPGIVLRAEENRIKDRDKEFPSFIRALGASESAKQSTTSRVLSTLREKDFGSLTPEIDDLYKRLNMRIDQSAAWRYFAADTRSYLIQKFSEMYLMGRQMGGDPKQLGELISRNMSEVNQLREQRQQSTVTMIGILYGITAASTFAFFIALQVVTILSNLTIGVGGSSMGAQLIHTEVYDIPFIRYLLYLVIMFNALISSLTIRTVDGGNLANAAIHFVALAWVGFATAVVTTRLVDVFLNV